MKYNEEERQQMIIDIVSKVIEDLEYCKEGDYWTMLFTDGSEFSFRFMAEIVDQMEEL